MAIGRNILSTTAMLLLLVGLFCTIILIFEETGVVEKLEYTEFYKIGASISNGFAVLFISYLILTSSGRSIAYKLFIAIILVIGLVSELVLTNIFSNLSPQYPAYIVIVFNILMRIYTLVQLIQEPWDVMTLTSGSSATTLPAIVKKFEKTVLPPNAERTQDADAAKFIEQWKSLFREARTKVGRDNFDELSRDKGFQEIIQPAVLSKDYSRDRLKAASEYLKDKSGTVISGLTFGGRKGKR